MEDIFLAAIIFLFAFENAMSTSIGVAQTQPMGPCRVKETAMIGGLRGLDYFRAEAFNLFNHAVYVNSTATLSSGGFEQVTSISLLARWPRHYEFCHASGLLGRQS
jgi:hypothetical protein